MDAGAREAGASFDFASNGAEPGGSALAARNVDAFQRAGDEERPAAWDEASSRAAPAGAIDDAPPPLASAAGPPFATLDAGAVPPAAASEPRPSQDAASTHSAPTSTTDAATPPLPAAAAPLSVASDADAQPRAPLEIASSHPTAADGLSVPSAVGESASAAWNGSGSPRTADAGPETPPEDAPTVGPGGSSPVSTGHREAALAAAGRDDPAPIAGIDSETPWDEGPTLPAAEIAGKSAEADSGRSTDPMAPPLAASAREGTAADAGAPGVEDSARALAAVEPPGRQPAAGSGSASAAASDGSRQTEPAPAPVARPGAGIDGALAIPGQPASGAPPATPPPERSASLPATLAATLLGMGENAATPPPKRRTAALPSQPDPRCRAIVLKAQLGEETSNAERSLLRSGCGARR